MSRIFYRIQGCSLSIIYYVYIKYATGIFEDVKRKVLCLLFAVLPVKENYGNTIRSDRVKSFAVTGIGYGRYTFLVRSGGRCNVRAGRISA